MLELRSLSISDSHPIDKVSLLSFFSKERSKEVYCINLSIVINWYIVFQIDDYRVPMAVRNGSYHVSNVNNAA